MLGKGPTGRWTGNEYSLRLPVAEVVGRCTCSALSLSRVPLLCAGIGLSLVPVARELQLGIAHTLLGRQFGKIQGSQLQGDHRPQREGSLYGLLQ
jgi:hypothetical protein